MECQNDSKLAPSSFIDRIKFEVEQKFKCSIYISVQLYHTTATYIHMDRKMNWLAWRNSYIFACRKLNFIILCLNYCKNRIEMKNALHLCRTFLKYRKDQSKKMFLILCLLSNGLNKLYVYLMENLLTIYFIFFLNKLWKCQDLLIKTFSLSFRMQ